MRFCKNKYCSRLQQFDTTGKVEVRKRAGRKHIEIPEIAPLLSNKLKLDPSMTLQEMAGACAEGGGTVPSKSTVSRALKKMNWKWKTMIRVPEGRNTAENIQRRYDFATEI